MRPPTSNSLGYTVDRLYWPSAPGLRYLAYGEIPCLFAQLRFKSTYAVSIAHYHHSHILPCTRPYQHSENTQTSYGSSTVRMGPVFSKVISMVVNSFIGAYIAAIHGSGGFHQD